MYSHDEDVLSTYPLSPEKGPTQHGDPKLGGATPTAKSSQSTTNAHLLPRFAESCFEPIREPNIEKLFLQQANYNISSDRESVVVDISAAVHKCFDLYCLDFKQKNDNSDSGDSYMIMTPRHLEAFQAQQEPNEHHNNDDSQQLSANWRPKWEHLFSAYFIEKIIHQCVMAYPRWTPAPDRIFDSLSYHSHLSRLDNGHTHHPVAISPLVQRPAQFVNGTKTTATTKGQKEPMSSFVFVPPINSTTTTATGISITSNNNGNDWPRRSQISWSKPEQPKEVMSPTTIEYNFTTVAEQVTSKTNSLSVKTYQETLRPK